MVPIPTPAPAHPIVARPAPMAWEAASIVEEERWRRRNGEDVVAWKEGIWGRLGVREGLLVVWRMGD